MIMIITYTFAYVRKPQMDIPIPFYTESFLEREIKR